MDLRTFATRWNALRHRAPVDAPDSDAADLGTAFGLDQSLSDIGWDEPAPAAVAASPAARWMQRFVARDAAPR